MADFQIYLSLNGASLPTGSTIHLIPGTMVQGAVIVQAGKEISCRGISLRAGWRTRGRGDTDRGRAFNVTIFQGSIPSGGATLPFQIQAPQAPWSYSGHYISIVWELIVECDFGFFQKPKFTYPLLLRPT